MRVERQGNQIVLTADTDGEEKRLRKFADDRALVTVSKATAQPTASTFSPARRDEIPDLEDLMQLGLTLSEALWWWSGTMADFGNAPAKWWASFDELAEMTRPYRRPSAA